MKSLEEEAQKYIIVRESDIELLIKKVNEYIELGYVPQGGVTSFKHTLYEKTWFAQALIKKI